MSTFRSSREFLDGFVDNNVYVCRSGCLQGKFCCFLSMGYLAVFPVMDGKRALYPGNLTKQRIIEDHMISHYKRLYSAKATVDCSVPKSVRCNVKYTDQKRREQVKKDVSERTQSVRSLSQRSLRLDNSPCSSRNARPSARGAESAYFNSGGSVMSSPRFSTSFHCKQVVYPSQMAALSPNCRPSSELSYRSPTSQRHRLTLSCATSSSQDKFQSFQDPTQKTYSGDILVKHAHCFTQGKPFTPRTLKTDCKSTLSKYRYYTPADRKGAEEKTLSKNKEDTQPTSKQRSSIAQDLLRPCSGDHEWSDEESNVFQHYATENKFRASDFFLNSSRVSPEGMRSPVMRKVTAEEEELMYLDFITDVTNEIILRGIFSDRVLQRVFERHIDINKQRLSEVKMRHLLEALQNDLQKPPSSSITVLENKERDGSLSHRHKDSSFQQELGNFTTEDTSLLSFTPFKDKDTWEPDSVTPRLDTTTVNGTILENANSVTQEDLLDLEQDHQKVNAVSQGLENHQLNEEDTHQWCADNDDLDELGRNISESLNVSEIHSSQEVIEQESPVKLSDDEF